VTAARVAQVVEQVEVTVPGAGVVRTCHAVADDRYLSPLVRCDGCGRDYDTDASATALMLARAVAPDSPDEGALATA